MWKVLVCRALLPSVHRRPGDAFMAAFACPVAAV
eukprot:gene41343-54671_t